MRKNAYKKISGLYCIRNLENNKKYIGQSEDLIKRIKDHKRMLKIGHHDNKYLQHAYNKYGEKI